MLTPFEIYQCGPGNEDAWTYAQQLAFGRAVESKAATEHQQALDFLCGLHTEVTIDGPPMAVAERIFDHVMAEQRTLQDRIRSLENSLERLHRLYAEARKEAPHGTPA